MGEVTGGGEVGKLGGACASELISGREVAIGEVLGGEMAVAGEA